MFGTYISLIILPRWRTPRLLPNKEKCSSQHQSMFVHRLSDKYLYKTLFVNVHFNCFTLSYSLKKYLTQTDRSTEVISGINHPILALYLKYFILLCLWILWRSIRFIAVLIQIILINLFHLYVIKLYVLLLKTTLIYKYLLLWEF